MTNHDDDRSRSEKLLGMDPDNIQHNYPADETLRHGLTLVCAAIPTAQGFIANAAQQSQDPHVMDKGSTLISAYEAFRVDLQALLDHTQLEQHSMREALITEIREGWPDHANSSRDAAVFVPPVRNNGLTAKLITFAVDAAIAKLG